MSQYCEKDNITKNNNNNNNNNTVVVMDYIGVTKREVKVEHEEKVKDGWVKLSKDQSGNLVQKFGKDYKNEYLIKVEKQDEIDKANAMLLRYEKYEEYDRELYYKDYINSWDPIENSDEESSIEDEESNDEDEYDDEQGDY